MASCDVSSKLFTILSTELLNPLQITAVDFQDCGNLIYRLRWNKLQKLKKARIHGSP